MTSVRCWLSYLMVSLGLAGTAAAQTQVSGPVVQTDIGAVRGVETGDVVSFKGVPFAAPPVGSLRWRDPQPAPPWQGVRDAVAFGPACMQTDDVAKSEDCLTLNVWRPAHASGPLPVMVWIYGGALVHGSAPLYPLQNLAAQGVVALSFNYRVGRFGFFAHPALAAEAPSEVLGNYGYMDQVAALRWVQRNIAAFGGDPRQVTLFGESAGGGSVLVHLISPLSHGLFQRAILQSAGDPGPRADAIPVSDLAGAEAIARDWARSLGIEGDDAAALARLRALPADTLLQGMSSPEAIAALSAGSRPPGMAMAIIDGKFLTEAPEAALAAGRQAMVPVIVGANDRDLGIGDAADKDALFALFGAAAPRARAIYDPLGVQTLAELKQQVLADGTLVEPARHLADEMAHGGQPVWLYRFAYVSEALRGRTMGTLHGFEIPFTIDVPEGLVGQANVTPTDRAMAAVASGYWVQFGMTGDPNGADRPDWPRYDPTLDRILHFTNDGAIIGTDPLKARLDLWKDLRGPPTTDASAPASVKVTLENFVRAETDRYFASTVQDGAFGKLRNRRVMAPVEDQPVVRMNRDTLYSNGVFDLDAGPVTITLPDTGKRFMSMQVVSEDHYAPEVAYAPTRRTITRETVGTRYAQVNIRTFADPRDPADMKAAQAAQDAITVTQEMPGTFDIPAWDSASRDPVRDALTALAALRGPAAGAMFGAKGEVDPIAHLIGTAIGWGGNPPAAATYRSYYPKQNDGRTVYRLIVKEVPVDGFWSVSVYDARGYFARNDLDAYSVSGQTAKRNADGGVTIQFGGCTPTVPNCLPTTPGWNYTVRLYRPRKPILDGSWVFPEAQPITP